MDNPLLLARHAYFQQDRNLPDNLVSPLIARSWERCRRFGLDENHGAPALDPIDRVALKTEQERNRHLLSLGRPVMEHVFEQIRDSGSMVILADSSGLLLETVGDPSFVDRAGRVALSAGASWDEIQRGTNAIGTALAEESAVEVIGLEHYLSLNGFLTCCASPIFGPDGRLMGVLDISGDYRGHQQHTLGLVRVSSALMEKRLFETLHAQDLLVCFHHRADYLASPKEGMAAVSADGQVLAINRQGLELLGIRRFDAVNRDFGIVFETSLAALIDHQRNHAPASCEIKIQGLAIHVQIRGKIPAKRSGTVIESSSKSAFRKAPDALLTLDHLDIGDAQLHQAIHRAKRVLNRDIPVLIQGESGAGKELFARAFHNSGDRAKQAFVAVNCASIPETLIESELFGYQGGAFTGARKEGALGKIQQAHGGTLFLDEIGDMPLSMQARLLRVLQERCVTPLGSQRTIPVDISLICATHRNLRDAVASGNFREDLYYRLNGLSVTLPALRNRTDFRDLVYQLLRETAGATSPIRYSEKALSTMAKCPWPGNIRQLNNVIRLAVALLEPGETIITEAHLPEEIFEPLPQRATSSISSAKTQGSLESLSQHAINQALNANQGNVSAAARQLGISRTTLYRKLNKH